MHRKRGVMSAFLGLTLFAMSVPSAAAQDAGVTLAEDRSTATTAGTSFTAPRSWSLTAQGPVTLITAPEGDLKLAIVEAGDAADARAAAAKAWLAYRPDAGRSVELITQAPARDGWDERQAVAYDVSPNERAAVSAMALRRGTRWTVFITEGSTATAEKRFGAIQLVGQSLRPPGYTKESFAGRTPRKLDAARIAELRAFVEQAARELGVPGVGLALIDRNGIVYEGGTGVRALGDPTPVDARTLFQVASNTKGMSTLLLSRLVDARRLGWDQPVTSLYPSFRLGSDETTSKVLVRHLVCACTGLPRKDFDFIFATRRDTPASSTFTQLAATEPTSGFGEVYQYNNLMASAAGFVGGHLLYPRMEIGAAFDRAMQTRIFAPLGMNDTTFDTTLALKGNHASPHGADIDGRPALGNPEIEYIVHPYRPAGGAWSNAHDMAQYVMLELNRGRLPNGKQLVSEASILKRREANVPVGESGSYGRGLQTDKSWGVEVVHHGGSMPGYKSDWFAIPEAGIGAVVLTNSDDGYAMLRPFMRRLLELVYGGNAEAKNDVAAAAATLKARRAADRPRLVYPPAADDTARLAAAYTNPDLGPLKIHREGEHSIVTASSWSSRLAARHNSDGTLSFIAVDPARLPFEFVVGTDRVPPTLTTRDGQHEYVFIPVEKEK